MQALRIVSLYLRCTKINSCAELLLGEKPEISEIKDVTPYIKQGDAIRIIHWVTRSEETHHNTNDCSTLLQILPFRNVELRALLDTRCSFPLISCCVTAAEIKRQYP